MDSQALNALPEPESDPVCIPGDTAPEFNTEKGSDSVQAIAHIIRAHGMRAYVIPFRGSEPAPFDILVNDRYRVEAKVCPRRKDGIWLFNIHRHGILDESSVDAYIIRLEGVPEFKYAIHLVIPSPIGSPTINISLRSLITRYARYYNRFDYIGGKDLGLPAMARNQEKTA